MTELRDVLEQLAERGTAVGPNVLYERARHALRQVDPTPDSERGRSSRRIGRSLRVAACVALVMAAIVVPWHDRSRHEIKVGPPVGPAAAQPRRGGQVVYGIESETPSGWCLPSGQLSQSGITVASALYDTLTVPARDADGTITYVPFLAESVGHDAAYMRWTIKLRSGVTFQDGEPLTAAAVKQNLDAYRAGVLFGLVLRDVATVQVLDTLTVRVVTTVPWVAFDAFLFSNGRLGIAAPKQLDDPTTCATHPIGTGPFRFVSWRRDDRLVVERNASYWRRDSEGRRLPYLDRIVFRPVSRVGGDLAGALRHGDVDIAETTNTNDVAQLRRERAAGRIDLTQSDLGSAIDYTMLNASKAPFDNRTARLALAHAVDVSTFIARDESNVVDRAVQPWGKDNIGYVEPRSLGFPQYDPTLARTLVRQYERATGRPLRFTLLAPRDAATPAFADFVRAAAEAVGMTVDVVRSSEGEMTNSLILGTYDAALWRSDAGGDPDTQKIWWSVDANGHPSVVNFGKIADRELDRLMMQGRSERDPQRRAQTYQAVSRRFATQVYDVWGWYTRWVIGSRHVAGLQPLPLPTGEAAASIAGYQPVAGLWRQP